MDNDDGMYDDLPGELTRLVEVIETMPGAFRGEFQLGFWGGVTEGADAWSIRVEADMEDTESFLTASTPVDAIQKALDEAQRRIPPAR